MFYALYFVAGFFVSMKLGEKMSFVKSLICGYTLTAILFLMLVEAW